jgi:hypothetical protein
MPDTGTDSDGTDADGSETDPSGTLSAVEPTSEDGAPGDESDGGSSGGSKDGSSRGSDGESSAETQGEIDAGIDLDDDGEPDITLSGRGPLQTVLIFVLVLFALDVVFNGGNVTTAILEALANTAGL